MSLPLLRRVPCAFSADSRLRRMSLSHCTYGVALAIEHSAACARRPRWPARFTIGRVTRFPADSSFSRMSLSHLTACRHANLLRRQAGVGPGTCPGTSSTHGWKSRSVARLSRSPGTRSPSASCGPGLDREHAHSVHALCAVEAAVLARTIRYALRVRGAGKLASRTALTRRARTTPRHSACSPSTAIHARPATIALRNLRAAWSEGLLTLRFPGGGFRETPTSIDSSPYYDGEGWLALAAYSDLHRERCAGGERDRSARYGIDREILAESESELLSLGGDGGSATLRDDRRRAVCVVPAGASGPLPQALPGRAKIPQRTAARRWKGWRLPLRSWTDPGTAIPRSPSRSVVGSRLRTPNCPCSRSSLARLACSSPEARSSRRRGSRVSCAFLLGLFQPTTRVAAAQHCLSAMTMAERDHLQLSK